MCSISDIPVLGKALDKISGVTVEAGTRGLRYLLCYNGFVNDLNAEIENVKILEDRIARKVLAERANGKTIEDHVVEWQKEVEEIRKHVDELSKHRPSWRFFKILQFPNPVSRFRLGRKAAQQAKNMIELTVNGEKLLATEIAYLPADDDVPMSGTTYQNFSSRQEAYGKIWEALVKEDSYPIIGIYGMPGVGKTRMVEQAWNEATEKKIFDKVIRANVGSGELNVINLQDQLASYLDCHFESKDNEVHRASQLKNSLKNGGRILVILDDVWDVIPLKIIGIPYGNGGCKILLTSRRQDVCWRNNSTNPIELKTLTESEAWDMFKNSIDNSKIVSQALAEKVCSKCGALPLLIQAVGKALKFVTENSWKDALYQLDSGKFEEIDGIEPQVYTCLHLSFQKLSEAAKTCLLLCSLFPEDSEIEIKVLFDFATGSGLLDRGRNINGVIDNLKSSSLLLEGKDDDTIKIHDTIRDVARSIAARDPKYAFLFVKGHSRLPDNNDYSSRKLIHFSETDNVLFPRDLIFPDLHTLWLQCNNQTQQFSKAFFEAFANLRILVIKGTNISLQHMSTQTFVKLRILILEGCALSDISRSIVSKDLETLRIMNCHLPNPLDLTKLKSLRKVELSSPTEIAMVPNSISNLSTLQELHIPVKFKIYDVATMKSVAISSELNKLTRLTSLKIHLDDSESSPDENIVANLLEYNITAADDSAPHLPYGQKSVLLRNRCIEGGWKALVERAEEVTLYSVNFPGNGFTNSNREAFTNLRMLKIHGSGNMKYLARIQQDGIHQGQPVGSFSNLISLTVSNCWTLKCLFSESVAKCLVQLQDLHAIDCPLMEVIIDGETINFPKLKSLKLWRLPRLRSLCGKLMAEDYFSKLKYLLTASAAKRLVQLQELIIFDCELMEVVIRNEDQTDGDIINLPKLKLLKLEFLPMLTSFYSKKGDMSSSTTTVTNNVAIPSTKSTSLFDGMVAFPSLEELRIKYLKSATEIWGKNYFEDNSFCQLKLFKVDGCPNFKFIMPLPMLHRLQNLKYLSIKRCDSLISEVEAANGSDMAEVALIALRHMSLSVLPLLRHTRLNTKGRMITSYPNLEDLQIKNCNSLRNVLLPSIARELFHLKVMKVKDCNKMTEIIGALENGEQGTNDGITFPALMNLHLVRLPNFQSFRCSEYVQAESYAVPKVTFPVLQEFKFTGHTMRMEEIELGKDYSACQIRTLDISCQQEVKLPSKWQLQLQNLEKLILQNSWWRGRTGVDYTGRNTICRSLFDPQGTLSFQRLKAVRVSYCGLSALFSLSVLRDLQQLQELEVSNCSLLNEIVEEDVRDDETARTSEKAISLFQLKTVVLKDLPSLSRCFSSHSKYAWIMPALEVMKVDNCALSTIFTSSVFGHLQTLEDLQVSNCAFLEEIVEGVVGDETYSTRDNNISLPQLRTVKLQNLQKLKSFSHSAISNFIMPELRNVSLLNCSEMENFTSSQISTPVIQISNGPHQAAEETSDINLYIKQKSENKEPKIEPEPAAYVNSFPRSPLQSLLFHLYYLLKLTLICFLVLSMFSTFM